MCCLRDYYVGRKVLVYSVFFFFLKSIAFSFFSYIKIKHLGSCEDHCDLLAIQFVVKLSAINISLCDSLSHTPLPQWLRLLASLELVMILTC